MSRSSEPITITLPNDWTPEQAWAVQECLDELLVQIQARYGTTVQQWLDGEDLIDDPFRDAQLDLFENDFDDPLPF
jgi:hypothetical protein